MLETGAVRVSTALGFFSVERVDERQRNGRAATSWQVSARVAGSVSYLTIEDTDQVLC